MQCVVRVIVSMACVLKYGSKLLHRDAIILVCSIFLLSLSQSNVNAAEVETLFRLTPVENKLRHWQKGEAYLILNENETAENGAVSEFSISLFKYYNILSGSNLFNFLDGMERKTGSGLFVKSREVVPRKLSFDELPRIYLVTGHELIVDGSPQKEKISKVIGTDFIKRAVLRSNLGSAWNKGCGVMTWTNYRRSDELVAGVIFINDDISKEQKIQCVLSMTPEIYGLKHFDFKAIENVPVSNAAFAPLLLEISRYCRESSDDDHAECVKTQVEEKKLFEVLQTIQ